MTSKITRRILSVLLTTLLVSSCTVTRYVPDGMYRLDAAKVKTDTKEVSSADLVGFIRQHGNTKWFGCLNVPMLPYMISGTDSTKRYNRFMHKVGETPVIYDTLASERTREIIENSVRAMGFLSADVKRKEIFKKHSVRVTYEINSQRRYVVKNISRRIEDDAIAQFLDQSKEQSNLYLGMPLDMNVLDAERTRITKLLRNNGYYQFYTNYVRFEADTTLGSHGAALTMIIENSNNTAGYSTVYKIGDVEYASDTLRGTRIKKRALERKSNILSGHLYSEEDVQRTYSNFMQMNSILGSNVAMTVDQMDSTVLNTHVSVTANKPHSFNMELEGTNSAGDFGTALSFGYQERNVFHGGELLSMKLRGAFEAIKGLEGYDDQNYIEYNAELSLAFPDFKFPFLSENFHRQTSATSEIAVRFDSQNRPEFHRRVVTGSWRYKWSRDNRKRIHRIDLLDINYVFMPWISKTFRNDYLDDPTSRNAILRYNYENLFIVKTGYSFVYNSKAQNSAIGNYGSNAFSIKFNIESAGNILYGATKALSTAKNAENHYTLFNIAYAQYVKGDFDWAKSIRLNQTNSLAMHFAIGVAYPYGNSHILPYEKRYFSGGANSVRGWSVRGLGPGRFHGTDGRIDFINQTGDIKLDMNLEYRGHIFWKIDYATFLDAGNIWTIRQYADQPGGDFQFDTFWRQIALAYGVGARFNFNFFILRLDAGMKAINPMYTDAKRHYPLVHPKFKRDCAVHFAVGLPF